MVRVSDFTWWATTRPGEGLSSPLRCVWIAYSGSVTQRQAVQKYTTSLLQRNSTVLLSWLNIFLSLFLSNGSLPLPNLGQSLLKWFCLYLLANTKNEFFLLHKLENIYLRKVNCMCAVGPVRIIWQSSWGENPHTSMPPGSGLRRVELKQNLPWPLDWNNVPGSLHPLSTAHTVPFCVYVWLNMCVGVGVCVSHPSRLENPISYTEQATESVAVVWVDWACVCVCHRALVKTTAPWVAISDAAWCLPCLEAALTM